MVAVVAVGIGGECADEKGAGWIVMVGSVEEDVVGEDRMLDSSVGEAIATDWSPTVSSQTTRANLACCFSLPCTAADRKSVV